MYRKPDGLTLVCQRPLDRLLDPPSTIGTQLATLCRPTSWQRWQRSDTRCRHREHLPNLREYINSLKQRRRVLSPPRCHSARVGTTSLTSDQPLSRSSKNCRILNIEESKIWLSPSSHRSTDERDTPSSRESRVLPQVDRLEKFRKRVKISAFSCSRRSLALVLISI